jgi:DNA-binding transcriptional ArsR family regulator
MDFIKAMNEERARLNTNLEELAKQKADIDAQILQVNTELKAIHAYESVKTGKPKATRTRAPRKSGVRQAVRNLITSTAGGIARADILKAMKAEDKQSQQSISNALSSLKKQGLVTADGGIYNAP